MAETIALGASIIAVIQIADRIISLCKDYIETVKDAPRDLHLILIETSSLKAVFDGLKFLQESGTNLSSNLRILDDKDGLIKGCQRCVSNLETLLSPGFDTSVQGKRRKIQVTLNSLAWPLKERKAKKLLDEILQYKTTITLALSSEST
jgi:hypothetical protein